jgi:hypothetical protein
MGEVSWDPKIRRSWASQYVFNPLCFKPIVFGTFVSYYEAFSAAFRAVCLKTIPKWKRFIDKHFHGKQDFSRWNTRFRVEATKNI